MTTTASARAFLAGLVDYAGLFPPASLSVDEAVAEYARQLRGWGSWILGRLVVPAARLPEVARAAEPLLGHPGPGAPWRLSALVGADLRADSADIASFNARHAGLAVVDSVELKASSPSEAGQALGTLPAGLTAYVELPPDADLRDLLPALWARGARAKVRTGGVVREAIPSPGTLARFVAGCAAAGVPFKATAGLHHPVRAERPLTYASDSPRAVVHGFVNLFTAASLARGGARPSDLEAVLQEEDPAAFVFGEDGLTWRRLHASTGALAETRADFAVSFGSCSFAEPLEGLASLGIVS
jgi:hypothetical protein